MYALSSDNRFSAKKCLLCPALLLAFLALVGMWVLNPQLLSSNKELIRGCDGQQPKKEEAKVAEFAMIPSSPQVFSSEKGSLCKQILLLGGKDSVVRPSLASSNDNDEDELVRSLVPVLLPHCQRRPQLPLEDLLPDLAFFKRIADAIQSSSSTVYALAAGRGTTGTRTLHSWIGAIGFASCHFVSCAACSNFTAGKCLNKNAQKLINHLSAGLANVRSAQNVSETDYQKHVLSPISDAFAQLMGECGDCGRPMLFTDSPFVNFITELYFSLPPETKVILTRRDAQSWASSRVEHHGHSEVGFVCRPPWRENQDPFSYPQCTSREGMDIGEAGEKLLMQAYLKYESYVHSLLVPGNFLLDINLFSSAVIGNKEDANAAREKWDERMEQVIRSFL